MTSFLFDGPCASDYYRGDIYLGNQEGAFLKCKKKTREEKRPVHRFMGGVLTEISTLLGSEEKILTRACVCSMCAAQAVDKRLRISQPFPKPKPKVAKRVAKVCRELKEKAAMLGGIDKAAEKGMRSGMSDVINSFTGNKKKSYENGLVDLETWHSSNGAEHIQVDFPTAGAALPQVYVAAFVKDEPDSVLDNLEDKGFCRRARLICPVTIKMPGKSPSLILIAVEGSIFLAIVKGKKRLLNHGEMLEGATISVPLFTSGFTLDEIAGHLLALSQFGLYFYKLDASSFDGSQYALAQIGRDIGWDIARRYFKNDPLWSWAEVTKQAQEDIRLHSSGMKAKHKQIRLSGTYMTSADNQLMYVCLIYASADAMGLSRPVLSCSGDDTMMGVTQAWREKSPEATQRMRSAGLDIQNDKTPLQLMEMFFKDMGVTMTIEQETDDIFEVVYCRMKLVMRGSGGYTMCKDPARVLDKLATIYRISSTGEIRDRDFELMYETCVGYNGLWGDVPVVGAMARAFGKFYLSKCKPSGVLRSQVISDNYILRSLKSEHWTLERKECSYESRLVFERAYGVTVNAQLSVEKLLEQQLQTVLQESLGECRRIHESFRGV